MHQRLLIIADMSALTYLLNETDYSDILSEDFKGTLHVKFKNARVTAMRRGAIRACTSKKGQCTCNGKTLTKKRSVRIQP